jgi:hypothetical protein
VVLLTACSSDSAPTETSPPPTETPGKVHEAGATTEPPSTTTPAPPSTTQPAPVLPPAPQRILLAGDSLLIDASRAIEAALATADTEIVVAVSGQSSRPRNDWQRIDWLERVDTFEPDLVVEYLSFWESAAAGLDETPLGAVGFAEAYRREVLGPWFDDLESRDIEVVALGGAPTDRADVSANIETVLDALMAEVGERPTVTLLPTADVLAPDGFALILPDPRSGRPERIRRLDRLHLCPDGGERVADQFIDHLEATYDVRFDRDLAGTGWRAGAWRDTIPVFSGDVPFVDTAQECPPVAP